MEILSLKISPDIFRKLKHVVTQLTNDYQKMSLPVTTGVIKKRYKIT